MCICKYFFSNKTTIMDCCLLCLEVNKELQDSIEANSKQWQDLDITKLLEKHFWALNILPHPCSWICSMCWEQVKTFHAFYLRIEESHINFGKLEAECILFKPKEAAIEDIKDASYCLEPEILIDQNELKAVVDIEEISVKKEVVKDDLSCETSFNKDPLTKPISPKPKHTKKSKRKPSALSKSVRNKKLLETKTDTSDSENKGNETASNDDDGSNCEPKKDSAEVKNRKDGDKFIAKHFKQMFCDLCDVPFENFTAMKKHFLLVHSMHQGYLVCCSRKFYQRNHLVDHLQCHFNPDLFKCAQCGKVLSDRKNLEGHMLRVHRSKDIVAKHTCDICGKPFTKAYVLKTHKLKHLPDAEKKFPCTQCGKLYASSYLLKLHTEVIHLKKQAKVCYICGKTLGTSTDYKAHMNKHEGVPPPIINCDVCGLRLGSDRSLRIHKESQHPVGGKKDHPCPLCDKVSPTARALKKHINTMHEKGFDHKCTLCEKAFRRPEALKEHMASHTGTPLYACPWCPKTFNSNGNMHAHRKNKHPIEYLEQKLQKYN